MDLGLPKGGVGEFWFRSKEDRRKKTRMTEAKEEREEWREWEEVRGREDAPRFSENESCARGVERRDKEREAA